MNKLAIGIAVLMLTGCVASLKDVSATLNACRAANMIPAVDENGVVEVIDGKPVMQTEVGACPAEWVAWNEADERHDALVARKKAKSTTNTCSKGEVPWCVSRGPNDRSCGCASRSDVRDVLDRSLGSGGSLGGRRRDF